jgi:NADPH:quinone reductase-like Zn-dependent oxidoreductase
MWEYTLIAIIVLYNVLYNYVYLKYCINPSFKGKNVLVTGASSRIGEELAI